MVAVGNSVLVKWALWRNNGKPFSVNRLFCRLFVLTGRGRNEIKNFCVSGKDNNLITWEMSCNLSLGSCTLRMEVLRQGLQIATVECRDAFRVVSRYSGHCDCSQSIELNSFVNIIHPEDNPDVVNVIFPSFELCPEDGHLHLKGAATEYYNDNFRLSDDGHLLYTN